MEQPCASTDPFPELIVITGPMYSGKTTEMHRIVYRNAHNKTCLVVNHVADVKRQNEELAATTEIKQSFQKGAIAYTLTHSGSKHTAFLAANLVADVLETPFYNKAQLIAIDEAQFFLKADLETFILRARYKDHKDIIVAGLHADSARKAFLDHNFLVSHATKFKVLSARCVHPECHDSAHQTFADFDKKGQIAVGVANYKPLCDKHYEQAINISETTTVE